jgi:polyphosphate glucokinase
MKILVIDVGGTNLKISAGGSREPIKVPSGPKLTPARMAVDVKKAIGSHAYDAVSIGYPGPVVNGRPAREPKNLAAGWVRFDYEKAFGKPVRIINDAAMQALGSYQKGRMLFLGLGTGLGSALVSDGVVEPLELAHLPYHKGGTYEDYVGLRGYERMGRRRWEKHVAHVVDLLKAALQVDYVMLGGGQAKRLKAVPRGARLGDNANAIQGGIRLWAHEGGKAAPVSVPAVRRAKRRKPAPAEKVGETSAPKGRG